MIKKNVFIMLFTALSGFQAHAMVFDTTCIGKTGRTVPLDTRVNIANDGVNQIEITVAGDEEYKGSFQTHTEQEFSFGEVTSTSGKKLDFDYTIARSQKSGDVTLKIAWEDERGNIISGNLKCVVLY